jgi:hypothetical protein
MFLDAMRDFLALASGGPISGNPMMPRLDLCLLSARLGGCTPGRCADLSA